MIHFPIDTFKDLTHRVDLPDLFCHLLHQPRICQVCFCNDRQVAVLQLTEGCLLILDLLQEVHRIHKADHALKIVFLFRSDPSRVQDLLDIGGISPAGAFHKKIVEILLGHVRQGLDKI